MLYRTKSRVETGIWLVVTALAIAFLVWAIAGCTAQELRSALTAGETEIEQLEADLDSIKDPRTRAWIAARLDDLRPLVEKLRAAADNVEAQGGGLELMVELAAAFFPPAGVAAFALRAWRRRKRAMGAVFASIDRGLPLGRRAAATAQIFFNPARARRALREDPWARRYYERYRASNPLVISSDVLGP